MSGARARVESGTGKDIELSEGSVEVTTLRVEPPRFEVKFPSPADVSGVIGLINERKVGWLRLTPCGENQIIFDHEVTRNGVSLPLGGVDLTV